MTDTPLPNLGRRRAAVRRRAAMTPAPIRSTRPTATTQPIDQLRRLQLALAALWLFDGVLQFQPYMFTENFAVQTLAPVARGNPAWVAGPIERMVSIVQHHPVAPSMTIGVVQIALGLGIAWRPTTRLALTASIAWALGVWWIGEGMGGLLAGNADPLTGAPGPALLYALAAVLLWPSAGRAPTPFLAAGVVGARNARVLWTGLWGLLAGLMLLPANTAPGVIPNALTSAVMGAPGWLVALNIRAARVADGREMTIAVVLAVLLAFVAAAVWLPWPRAVRAGLFGAFVLAAVIWVFGESFGMPFQGMATDLNSAPLLALLAAAYWPGPWGRAGAVVRPGDAADAPGLDGTQGGAV